MSSDPKRTVILLKTFKCLTTSITSSTSSTPQPLFRWSSPTTWWMDWTGSNCLSHGETNVLFLRFKTLPHISMFRDVLYKNMSEATLTRVLATIYRLQSHLVTTLEKLRSSSSRTANQDWLSDRQFKLGKFRPLNLKALCSAV